MRLDLVRFGMFHLKAHLPDQVPILSDASIEDMQKPTATSNPEAGTGYGIGWFINDSFYGYRTVAHDGSMAGVATFLRLVPSEKIAVVVLCNSIDCGPGEVVDKILLTILPKWRVAPVATTPASRPAVFQPPPALVGRWTGAVSTYKRDIPVVLDVLPSGDVQVQLANQLKMLLNGVTWSSNTLSGYMLGNIGIEEGGDAPYLLTFNLNLRGNLLNGPRRAGASARSTSMGIGSPNGWSLRRTDSSHHELKPLPGRASLLCLYAFVFPRFLRIESPRISIRCALCTSRSRIPSASVGSPICSCQRETGSCEVRTVERT